MDANQNENNIKVGDAFISLDVKSRAVFYEVSLVEEQNGATWIELAGLQFQDSLRIPLLYLDKSFARVNESTVKALFGERKKNGNAKQETSHAQSAVKSLSRKSERRSVGERGTSRVVKTHSGPSAKHSSNRDTPKSGDRSQKRN